MKTCRVKQGGKEEEHHNQLWRGCVPNKENLIFILTGKELKPHEVSLLNKGLSFVPTRTTDPFFTIFYK